MPGNSLATNQQQQQQMLTNSPSLQLDLKLRQQQQLQFQLSQVETDPTPELEPCAAFPNSQLQLLSGASLWAASSTSSSRDSWDSSLVSNGAAVQQQVQSAEPAVLPVSQSLPMLQHLQQLNRRQSASVSQGSVYSLGGNFSGQLPIGPLQQLQQLNQQQQQQRGSGAFWQGIVGCFRPVWNVVGGRATAAVPMSKQTRQQDWCADESEVTELGFLASGSQGSVSLVLHRGRQLALKRFNDPSQQALQVPLRELSHLGRLNHPHVVKFIACLDGVSGPGLLMEFCPHGNLFDYYTVGTDCLSAVRVADWSRQLASGMAYLHECRIAHGDLKSPNILLSELDTLKISDFGLVPPCPGGDAAVGEAGHGHRQQQQLYGTMRWMSPEQCRQEAWSYPADVYSYGVILWELLFMEVPYKCVDPWAVMLGVGQGSLSLPVPGHTPALLASLMQACWSVDANHRPSFRGIAAALGASGLTDLLVLNDADLRVLRKVWSAEIASAMSSRVRREDFKAKLEADLLRRRRDELHHAADIRLHYEKRLRRLDELQMALTNAQIRQQLRDKADAKRADRLREVVRERCCRRCRRALRGLVDEDAASAAPNVYDSQAVDGGEAPSAAAAPASPKKSRRCDSGIVLDRPIRAAISMDCLAAKAAAAATGKVEKPASSPPPSPPSSPVATRGIGDRGEPFRQACRRRAPPTLPTQPPPPPRPLASDGEPQLRSRPGRRGGCSTATTTTASSSSASTSSALADSAKQLRLSTDLLSQELQEHLAGDRLSECEARLGGLVHGVQQSDAASGNSDLDEQIDRLRNLSVVNQRGTVASAAATVVHGKSGCGQPPMRLNSSIL